VKKPPEQPVLITDAARSPEQQFHSRQIRYGVMMGLRVLCLIVGAVVTSLRVPFLPLWWGLCLLGMVMLPWMAVLIANDRPAKTKAERAASAPVVRPQPTLAQHSAEEVEYLTIDADFDDSGKRWTPQEPKKG
jgi:threonine/homoserine/homoserine lactone efflux protein